jgi:hypothetical protein
VVARLASSWPGMLPGMLCRLARRRRYQCEMRHAYKLMDRPRRRDPAAWQEYLSELRAFGDGTADAGTGPFTRYR